MTTRVLPLTKMMSHSTRDTKTREPLSSFCCMQAARASKRQTKPSQPRYTSYSQTQLTRSDHCQEHKVQRRVADKPPNKKKSNRTKGKHLAQTSFALFNLSPSPVLGDWSTLLSSFFLHHVEPPPRSRKITTTHSRKTSRNHHKSNTARPTSLLRRTRSTQSRRSRARK